MLNSPNNVLDHPAVHAFLQIRPEYGPPSHISTLKDRSETQVYRLEGIGSVSPPVIAKCCRRPNSVVERLVYESILPQIRLSKPAYYGSWIEPVDGSVWLFTEDAGETWYSPTDCRHRRLAAQWLGHLHATTATLAEDPILPDRGTQHYLDVLRATITSIRSALNNHVLSDHDLNLLWTILQQLKLIELHWGDVEEACDRVPKTLIHGDFVSKNVRVRYEADRLSLLPFDWESAGRGTPAVDLEKIDIEVYQSVVRSFWPQCDRCIAQNLAHIGRLFRLIMLIFWASEKLDYSDAETIMQKQMVFYLPWLESAIHAVGW